jgi:hypothetical protein
VVSTLGRVGISIAIEKCGVLHTLGLISEARYPNQSRRVWSPSDDQPSTFILFEKILFRCCKIVVWKGYKQLTKIGVELG